MDPRTRRLAACALIATLAIVGAVGEGLHFLPGLGHADPVGNRYVLLGIWLPERGLPTLDGSEVDGPGGRSIPLLDEDQCVICSLLGKRASPGGTPQFILVVPVADAPPPVAPCEALAAPTGPFDARAPPFV